MRAAWLTWATLAVIGCGRVDSNRTITLDEHPQPAPAGTEPARPATTAADQPAVPVTAPTGTGSATAGVGRPTLDDAAAGEPARADNTVINERDRDPAAKTPFDQGENEPDRTTTANIRQRIVNADNMSINARNVKIITAGGKVTLRGPVNSAAERESIVRFAREVAGESNVEDQLEVASSNP